MPVAVIAEEGHLHGMPSGGRLAPKEASPLCDGCKLNAYDAEGASVSLAPGPPGMHSYIPYPGTVWAWGQISPTVDMGSLIIVLFSERGAVSHSELAIADSG